MAKNLKLSIKNTQLAEALKLGKAKRPSSARKEKSSEEKVPLPAEAPVVKAAPLPPVKKEEPVITPPPPAPVEPKVVQPLPAAPAAPISSSPPQHRPTPPPRQTSSTHTPSSYPPRRPYPSYGDRPQYSRPPQYSRLDRPTSYQTPPRSPSSQRPGGFGPRPPFNQRPYDRPSGGPPGFRRPSPPRPYSVPPLRPTIPPKDITRSIDPQKKHPRGNEERKGPPFKEYRDLKPQKKQGEQRTFDSRDRQGLRDTDNEGWRKRRIFKQRSSQEQEEFIIRPKQLKIRIPVTIKDLASDMKIKASELLAKLFIKGVVLTLNDFLDDETTIQLLGQEFDCEIGIDTSEEQRLRITEKTIKQEIQETPADQLILRPPVIAFMGHVDHGKTSLIDTIRKTNTAAGEAGAITQHIGAFKCHTAVGDITILDTPGHEAFSAMRTRGADVTDIVVLVIAGDEGMRTQTIEAMQQAKQANVPIVVAINKADKPNFNVETVYRQLSENELLPEAWGGTTITISCSAVTGQGVKELLEMLALQAEILELKANPKSRARGTVIESEMHKGLGAVATVLVQNGTLRNGDAIVFATHYARVKTMHDENGKEILQAGPSTPIKITGLSGLPGAGSEFIVVKSEKEARDLSHGRSEGHKTVALQQSKRSGGLESLLKEKAESIEKKTLNLILKADVQGSLEALRSSLMKIESTKADLNVISAEVGEISESDIELAAASKATIIGFHTQIESRADSLIKQNKVTVRLHDIIYHAVDDVRELMTALLDKIPQETDTGKALVKATFKASQLGIIAGCQVTEGTIKRSSHIRVMRNGSQVWKGPITSLKKVKEDIREVGKGHECGILLQNFNDVKADDILEAFEITYLTQTL